MRTFPKTTLERFYFIITFFIIFNILIRLKIVEQKSFFRVYSTKNPRKNTNTWIKIIKKYNFNNNVFIVNGYLLIFIRYSIEL